MLFSSDNCSIVIEEAISKKTGKKYTKLVLVINGNEYISFDNQLISKVLLDSLLKK